MTSARSCSVSTFHQSGVAYSLPPYGAETRYGPPELPSSSCHDCGVEAGGFHHIGCDWAECPVCHRQMISCGCRFDEDGEWTDDDEDEDDGWGW